MENEFHEFLRTLKFNGKPPQLVDKIVKMNKNSNSIKKQEEEKGVGVETAQMERKREHNSLGNDFQKRPF